MTAVPPDARLPGLHAEAGDPHTRLSRALADLEGAAWGLLVADQTALARQLAAHFGPGTVRVDARLGVSREVFASAGLAVATIDADWRGAVAVWLLEPDERALKRAKRADVPVIVDATLAPGGGWLEREATMIVYRDAATLSGFGDVSAAALFGAGAAPPRVAPAPSDLSLAMILRDLASLPLRLARAARTTATLLERFGGAAQATGPTALLLAPDSAADTHQPVGGVLAAARNVGIGTLITPGVQGLDAVLALLRSDEPVVRPASAEPAHDRSCSGRAARRESERSGSAHPGPGCSGPGGPAARRTAGTVNACARSAQLRAGNRLLGQRAAPGAGSRGATNRPPGAGPAGSQRGAAPPRANTTPSASRWRPRPARAASADPALQPEGPAAPQQTRRGTPLRERRGRRDFQPRGSERAAPLQQASGESLSKGSRSGLCQAGDLPNLPSPRSP